MKYTKHLLYEQKGTEPSVKQFSEHWNVRQLLFGQKGIKTPSEVSRNNKMLNDSTESLTVHDEHIDDDVFHNCPSDENHNSKEQEIPKCISYSH